MIMKKSPLVKMLLLTVFLCCSLSSMAAVAYANYTPANTTLTFYYDNLRNSRSGSTYSLNTGSNDTGWETAGINSSVTQVVFHSSFANARPTTTYSWFYAMTNLQTITGISNLKTNSVTNMSWMFADCQKLTTLDLSGFYTVNVTNMEYMFMNCINLVTIYASSSWATSYVNKSTQMFGNCKKIRGDKGTTFDANHVDKAYAHLDGGPSIPGYLSAKSAGARGDVNEDNTVNISDVTLLISAALNENYNNINRANSDMDGNGVINISDVTALITIVMNS